ncbi:MAG: hypothetical protein CVU71_04620 [Deltaproteobacteria bacterium HGW-Deltaproteobacteria-6]|nr:MAG: hypothetical protein CVU71_04620 [Deltaproteobacteria bacterium HGW-Deltaproteobacteria-6]
MKSRFCIILTFILIIISFSSANAQNGWKTFTNKEQLLYDVENFREQNILQTDKTEEIARESNKLLRESIEKNRAWDELYFSYVSQLQDTNERLLRYKSLLDRKIQIIRVLKQIDETIDSVREIYKNRLKAIPTGYLLLSKTNADIFKESRKDINRKLDKSSKHFLSENYMPSFITGDTTVKQLKVVSDIIRATEAGRVESFETDPVTQMSSDLKDFYMLQQYRIYPEFAKVSHTDKTDQKNTTKTDLGTFSAKVLLDPDKGEMIDKFTADNVKNKESIKNMYKQTQDYNLRQLQLLTEIDHDYQNNIGQAISKKNKAKNKLDEIDNELESSYKDVTIKSLHEDRTKAENMLVNHVREREMILLTVQSEVSQSEDPVKDLFKKMAKGGYEDLLMRAEQLKSYKFFVVVDHVLRSEEASTFYSKAVPVAYNIPIVRISYRPGEGGILRCGVLLGLKVKFSGAVIPVEDPEKEQKLMANARKAFILKKYDEAINYATELIMIDSKNVKAMKILALSYTKMDNNNKACDVYRKMLELNPRDVEAQEGLQKTCN